MWEYDACCTHADCKTIIKTDLHIGKIYREGLGPGVPLVSLTKASNLTMRMSMSIFICNKGHQAHCTKNQYKHIKVHHIEYRI